MKAQELAELSYLWCFCPKAQVADLAVAPAS